MSSQDDPEARIRELEQSLGEQTFELTRSSSELGPGPYGGPPPPPPSQPPPGPYTAPMPYPVAHPPYATPFPTLPTTSTGAKGRGSLPLVVMGVVMVAIVAGVAFFVSNVFSGVNSFIDTFNGSPTASGGGGPFSVPASRSNGNPLPAPTFAPSSPATPGGDISVSGVGEDKTLECSDSVVSISGVSNTVVLTGQCRSVSVSGVENTVTIGAAGSISASGFNNRITFLSGTPDVQNSGDSNTVEPG